MNTQKMIVSELECNKCQSKCEGNYQVNKFFRWLSCQKNWCLLCRSSHNLNHNIILYDQKNYICQKHNEPIINYYKTCKENICFSCEGHENHESIFLKDLKPNTDEMKKILDEMKKVFESINIKILKL